MSADDINEQDKPYMPVSEEDQTDIEDCDPDEGWLGAAERLVTKTHQTIIDELVLLREKKQQVQDRINELDEAERLWAPMARRVNEGIPTRKRDDDE